MTADMAVPRNPMQGCRGSRQRLPAGVADTSAPRNLCRAVAMDEAVGLAMTYSDDDLAQTASGCRHG